jgi:capsid protein
LFGDSIPPNHLAHEWIPQGKPWVDPTKEIDAAIRATEFGIDARSNIAMERGYDFGELCRRNEQDRKLMESHGLTGGADGEEETEGPDSPAGGG